MDLTIVKQRFGIIGNRRTEQGTGGGFAGGSYRFVGPCDGRKRGRKGVFPSNNPRQQQPQARQLHRGQLRSHSRRDDRLGAFRTREGSVHGRDGKPQGLFRGSGRRHDLPRRSGRAAAHDPSPAVARTANRRVHPRRGRRKRRRPTSGSSRRPTSICAMP